MTVLLQSYVGLESYETFVNEVCVYCSLYAKISI